jgi:hypothetical protein
LQAQKAMQILLPHTYNLVNVLEAAQPIVIDCTLGNTMSIDVGRHMLPGHFCSVFKIDECDEGRFYRRAGTVSYPIGRHHAHIRTPYKSTELVERLILLSAARFFGYTLRCFPQFMDFRCHFGSFMEAELYALTGAVILEGQMNFQLIPCAKCLSACFIEREQRGSLAVFPQLGRYRRRGRRTG